jgi:isochorismate pyruvate lyase
VKSVEDCKNISEIRAEVDRLGREVISLLGQRFAFVKAASRFKIDETSVRAPERFWTMLEQRRTWASEEGLNADAIEKMFRDLIDHFIEEELKHWQASKPE